MKARLAAAACRQAGFDARSTLAEAAAAKQFCVDVRTSKPHKQQVEDVGNFGCSRTASIIQKELKVDCSSRFLDTRQVWFRLRCLINENAVSPVASTPTSGSQVRSSNQNE
jgi:hypothetical protein